MDFGFKPISEKYVLTVSIFYIYVLHGRKKNIFSGYWPGSGVRMRTESGRQGSSPVLYVFILDSS